MHDVATSSGVQAARASAVLHRVLALPGDVTPAHLLELAHCCVPRDRELDLFMLPVGADCAVRTRTLEAEPVQPDYSPERVSTVLRCVHDTNADALVLGYPGSARGRSHFTDVVERVTAAAALDVVVCVERHGRPWRRVLVPYLYGPLDGAALRIARRFARAGSAEVTVLHVVEATGEDDHVEPLLASVGDCSLKVVTAADPVTAAADEARRGYDLIVLGGREPRLGRGRYFTVRQQRLLLATDASLVIAHPGRSAATR
jgi:hypothetical protein